MSGPPLAAERARMHPYWLGPYWLERNLYRGTTRPVVEECARVTVREARRAPGPDVVLVATPQRIGRRVRGVRWWLVCPVCAQRRTWLFLLDDGGRGYRVCCGIPYRSQHLSRGTRRHRRAYGLIERLGGVDAAGVLWKPPRMRWVTYTRLWRRIQALETGAGWSSHPLSADPRLGPHRVRS